MNLPLIALLAYFFFAMLINIKRVGKVRVKTPGEAASDAVEYVILAGLVVWAVVW